MDQRLSNMGSVLTSALAAAWTILAKSWRTLIADDVKVYRPEAYYMRGPGPKWREKHVQGRASIVRWRCRVSRTAPTAYQLGAGFRMPANP